MIIERPLYLSKLIAGMGSSQVKVVTGIRRCGKSFLLSDLFKPYLLAHGVPEGNVFQMAFDKYANKRYRDPEVFYPHVTQWLGATRGGGMRYVMLDEVQLLGDFSDILIDLMSMEDVDVYVTGSNAKLLSRDVVTEFRGRGREIAMAPLTFSEFMTAYDGDKRDGYVEYATYGGLPAVLAERTPEAKTDYLNGLFREIYIRDIVDRYEVRDPGNLETLIDVLASSIGSLTNSTRLSATFKSEKRVTIASETIDLYISYLQDSFLVNRVKRYDVKGKRYIGTPFKFYFSDLGLRNARLNYRQMEETHIMENVIYNELAGRGMGVDVGVVPITQTGADGKAHRAQLEVDFVCNRGSKRYYIQSAYAIPDEEKRRQESRSLLRIDDAFKKVIVTKDGMAPHYDDNGVLWLNVFDFLLDPSSLDF